MKSVLLVVLRKDMSLNRRLYAWLDSCNGIRNDLDVQDVLVCACKSLFQDVQGLLVVTDITRPFKILISLLDRTEVGAIVLENMFIDVVGSIKQSCEEGGLSGATSTTKEEILRNANMFLGMVDPWTVGRQFNELIKSNPTPENMNLVLFYISECVCSDEESRFDYSLL